MTWRQNWPRVCLVLLAALLLIVLSCHIFGFPLAGWRIPLGILCTCAMYKVLWALSLDFFPRPLAKIGDQAAAGQTQNPDGP